jgi:azurin
MKRIFLTMAIAAGLLWGCGGNETPSDSKDKTNSPAKEEKPMTQEEMKVEEVSIEIATVGETMTEMAYSPKQISVPAGAEVTLTLNNQATAEAMIHNVVVIKAGQQTAVSEAALAAGKDANYLPDPSMYIAATSLANPGETVEVKFKAPSKKGTYQYICTYPGHTAMKGLLVVK